MRALISRGARLFREQDSVAIIRAVQSQHVMPGLAPRLSG